MPSLSSFVQLLPILASGVMGSARLPDKPADLSTPVQQRIAINGPNSAYKSNSKDLYGCTQPILTQLQASLLVGALTKN